MRKHDYCVASGFSFLRATTALRIATPFIKLTCPRLRVTSSDFHCSTEVPVKGSPGFETFPCKSIFLGFTSSVSSITEARCHFSTIFVEMSACWPLLWHKAAQANTKSASTWLGLFIDHNWRTVTFLLKVSKVWSFQTCFSQCLFSVFGKQLFLLHWA